MTPNFQKADIMYTIKILILTKSFEFNFQIANFLWENFCQIVDCPTYILKYFDLLIFHFLREALLGLHDLALLGVFLLPS